MYACSAKQVKRFLKDPLVCIFVVLALAKATEQQMNAEELISAYHFAFKHFKDCDEFVNNVFRLDLAEVPVVHKGLVWNVLFWNSHQGCDSHVHVYQQSDLYNASKTKLCMP